MQGFGKHVVLLALAAVAAGGAHAAPGNKQGPRSSVSVDTVCKLDKVNPSLNVELRVRDKSSNNLGAVVIAYEVSALAKVSPGNWESQEVFETQSKPSYNKSIEAGGMITIPISFSLCVPGDKGFQIINPIVGGSKGLNASARTTYGNGTVMNMCSDDPNTTDVVEPSGIKLSAYDIAIIAQNCGGLANPTY